MNRLQARLRTALGRDLLAIARGAAALYSLRLLAAVLAFVTQVLFARWMVPAEFGTYVFAFSLTIVGGFIATLGFTVGSLRFLPRFAVEEDRGAARGFGRVAPLSTLLAGLLIGGAAALVSAALHGFALTGDAVALLLGCAGIPLFALLATQSALAQGHTWLMTSFVPQLVLRPAVFLASVLLAVALGVELTAVSVMLLMLGSLAAAWVVQAAILLPRLARAYAGAAPRYAPRIWLAASAPTIVETGYVGFFVEVNLLIAGFVLSEPALAVYAIAFRLAHFIGLFQQAVGSRVMPEAARLWALSDLPALQTLISRATALRFGFSAFATLGLVLLGYPILLLFGPAYAEGYGTLVILALAQLVMGAAGPAAQLLSLSGHQGINALTSASIVTLNVVATLQLGAAFGVDGAAMAVLATTSLWMLWLNSVVKRRIGLKPSILAAPAALRPQAPGPAAASAVAPAAAPAKADAQAEASPPGAPPALQVPPAAD